MSKGNMLLGHARGKVGDLVFSRTNGQQVVRARAAVVKNPQTEAQMIQRIILNTVAQAYSKMQPIVDHSFEGIQSGQKTMSAFMAKNLKVLRARVSNAVADPTQGLGEVRAFVPVGENGFVPNAYIVSMGSLPGLTPVLESTTAAKVGLGGATYGDIIAALGLQRGDQLTFCNITGESDAEMRFDFARVILDPQNEDGSEAPLSSALIVDGAINLPSKRNTGNFYTLTQDAQNVVTYLVGDALRTIAGTFIIVSRKGTDNNWKRSNAQMVINEGAIASFLSMQEALDRFIEGGVGTLSDMYLNNAGTGQVAGSASGATFTAETKGGTEVTLVRVANVTKQNSSGSAQYLVAIDANGAEHCLQNGNEDSPRVMSYFASNGTAVSNYAPTGNVENNNIAIASTSDDIMAWLMAAGVSPVIYSLI